MDGLMDLKKVKEGREVGLQIEAIYHTLPISTFLPSPSHTHTEREREREYKENTSHHKQQEQVNSLFFWCKVDLTI